MSSTDGHVPGWCPCGGDLGQFAVTVTMTSRDEDIAFTGVPQIRCGSCGSRFYSAVVLESLEAAMRGWDLPLSAGHWSAGGDSRDSA